MILQFNSSCPIFDREPNIDGITSYRFFWLKNFEKISWRNFAIEVMFGTMQILFAIGEASELNNAIHNQAMKLYEKQKEKTDDQGNQVQMPEQASGRNTRSGQPRP